MTKTKDPQQVVGKGEEPLKQKSISKLRKADTQVDKALADFIASHHKDLRKRSEELQQMRSETHALQLTTIEKDECIQNLKKKRLASSIEMKNQEIAKCRGEIEKLKQENEALHTRFGEFKDKFCYLEVTYDQNIATLRRESARLKAEVEQQIREQQKQLLEFAANCKDLQQQLQEKNDAYNILSEDFKLVLQNLEQSKKELTVVQADYERYEKQMTLEKENYIKTAEQCQAMLKQQLQEKDETIEKCIKDKEQVEELKNKIIEEQAFKMREIERVFEQPTRLVQPIRASSSKTAVDETAAEAPSENVAVTFPRPQRQKQRQVAVKVSQVSTTNAKPQAPNPPQTRRRQNVQVEQERQKIPSPPKLPVPTASARNEFGSDSDSDDSVFRHWHPRPKVDENYVPDTSESDVIPAKRPKN